MYNLGISYCRRGIYQYNEDDFRKTHIYRACSLHMSSVRTLEDDSLAARCLTLDSYLKDR